MPQFGVRHGADIPFVMQTVNTLDPNASLEIVDLEHTIGDYWYVHYLPFVGAVY